MCLGVDHYRVCTCAQLEAVHQAYKANSTLLSSAVSAFGTKFALCEAGADHDLVFVVGGLGIIMGAADVSDCFGTSQEQRDPPLGLPPVSSMGR